MSLLKHRIEYLFFDAGNTLIEMDAERVVRHMVQGGVAIDLLDFRFAEGKARISIKKRLDEGKPGDFENFFEEIAGHLGLTIDERVRQLMNELRASDKQKPLWTKVIEGTVDGLERIKKLGLPMAVISNADGRVASILKETGLAPFFEFIIDSQEVGVEKPDPRIFKIGLQRAKVNASVSAYIGDLYHIDVLGSRDVGMHAYLLDPFDLWTGVDCDKFKNLPDFVSWLEKHN